MYIIPAIDLRGGKCVRLIQGQYDRQITYKDDPAAQAQEFASAGAKWLHVVDLDGAKIGKPVNTESIAKIVAGGQLKVEVGGGIRNEQSINELLDMGVERVIIGTKAVTDFDWFSEMAEKYNGKLVLGLDAKGSNVATQGWTQSCGQTIMDFAAKAAELPLAAIIYTDIAKDGMMSGPNFERTKELADSVDIPVVASGGVCTAADIKKLVQLGSVAAAIVGRAIYEGTITVEQAIEAAEV